MSSEARGRILLELARGVGRWGSDLAGALAHATEATAGALAVERVGIWLFDDEKSRIVCTDLYHQSTGRHEAGCELRRDRAPGYFQALESERIVAAEDAETDPRTRAFTESYLRPAGIGAMLDAPIFHAGELAGVVCHEHVGGARIWTVEDRSFAASIGDYVGVILAERQRQETAAHLERSERQFRLLAEHSRDMIVELDLEGKLLYVSPSHEDVLGYPPSELVGTRAFDRVHPDDIEKVVQTIQAGFQDLGGGGALFRYRHRDGRWLWVEGRGQVYQSSDGSPRAVVSTRDVSARVEAEEAARELHGQLSQMQRLEAVGRLAGGIAHDFNNLLTAILGHLEAAVGNEACPGPIATELDEASSVVTKAAELTQQLLALGRSRAIAPRPTHVNDAIEAVSRIIRRLIGEDIVFELDLAPELPRVSIDPTQLDQVLMNLAINCRDAMPDGGRLSIRTRLEHVALGSGHEQLGGQPGPHVRIDVADSGAGMDASTRARVFDPFFTTKARGKGAGLGLSTVYQIVREARGGIDLESRIGRGTVVSVRLPALEAPAWLDDGGAGPARGRPERELGGSERILLVEDEEYVRRPLERAVARQGYEVVTARHGREALDLLASLEGRIDLVVSDVVMPVMGGIELGRRLAREHPEVKLLLVSGYAPPDGDSRDGLPCDGVLQKPFSSGELLHEVRSLLERRGRSLSS